MHLELRIHQGVATPDRARSCIDGILAGYAPSPTLSAGLPAYGLAARLRLLCVYAFRPHSTTAALRLITHPLLQETS